ncbi:MAG: polymer-forming cytoskeletal protein [Desulfatiglandales bacterium]
MKKNEDAVTFLGKGTAFEGTLASRGGMSIDGHFKGEIRTKGDVLVGKEGMIEADMHVSSVVIRGEVHGNITADRRVEIRVPGKVFGNILAPAVVIDEGVIFEGQTKMYQAEDPHPELSNGVDADSLEGGRSPGLRAVYGVVSDESTGKPLRHAEVKCRGEEKRVSQSNASGYYEFVNLAEGSWRVKATAKGYKKLEVGIQLSEGGTCRQDFSLRPKKKGFPEHSPMG